MATDLSAILRGYPGRMEEVARKAVVALAGQVITGTPVDLGTLRGDWSIGLNSAAQGRGGNLNAMNEAELQTAVAGLKVGGFVTFYNQMPYVRRIEYEGWSNQAPNGMLWVNVKRWEDIVMEVARGT